MTSPSFSPDVDVDGAPLRLVLLGDVTGAGAGICDGDVCLIPVPPASDHGHPTSLNPLSDDHGAGETPGA